MSALWAGVPGTHASVFWRWYFASFIIAFSLFTITNYHDTIIRYHDSTITRLYIDKRDSMIVVIVIGKDYHHSFLNNSAFYCHSNMPVEVGVFNPVSSLYSVLKEV